ncbi:MAG: DUF6797 domain-containing protein [Planctomycetota bacterium]
MALILPFDSMLPAMQLCSRTSRLFLSLSALLFSCTAPTAQDTPPDAPPAEEAVEEQPTEPVELPRHAAMDYGPILGATVQGSGEQNFAYKGRIVFLPMADGSTSSQSDCGVVFDTELLRVVGAYGNESIALRGTTFDGAHGPVTKIPEGGMTRTVPEAGIRGPKDNYDDPRAVPYGPLPEEWGRYVGHWMHKDRIVIGYTALGRGVLETYDAVRNEAGEVTGIVRSFEIGPGSADLQFTLVSVADPRESGGLRVELIDDPNAVGGPPGGRPGAGEHGGGRPTGRPGGGEQGGGRPGGGEQGGGRPGGGRGHGGQLPSGANRFPSRPERPPVPAKITSPFVQFITTLDHAYGVAIVGAKGQASLENTEPGRIRLNIPGTPFAQKVSILHRHASTPSGLPVTLDETVFLPKDVAEFTRPGENPYPEEFVTQGTLGADSSPFAVDTITIPESNPYKSWLRFAAFDFIDEDSAALSTWSGDVWIVRGLAGDLQNLTWRRFCTGLHDPLGLLVVDGLIHVHCRDGIYMLIDDNRDGWCDFVEVFNNEVYVTEGFHEFSFDLQTDDEGNFYFSKGGPVNPGGRGFMTLTPHSGTILRCDEEGQNLEVLATGCRAPNGISVRGDGVFTTGDNEGTWVPACRLSISTNGDFFGCVDLAHAEPAPRRYDPPICFFPMSVDNSCGGQVWVPEGHWDELGGGLLHQSYGQCSLFYVLQQMSSGGVTQGAVYRLPVQFRSTPMRSRFGQDGHLYLCGFRGWQTNASQETGFQRVRRTEKPLQMPISWEVTADGVRLEFTEPLDAELAADVESYELEMWNYKWSEAYGSREYSVRQPSRPSEAGEQNRDPVKVLGAIVSEDRKSVMLALEDFRICMQLRIGFDLETENGDPVTGELHGTVNYFQPRGQSGR